MSECLQSSYGKAAWNDRHGRVAAGAGRASERPSRRDLCVPTARLYPFQWNWDSAFVAMGWATFDEARGWSVKGQWEDGLVPQIVFHAPSDYYFPGPEAWGIARTPPTSGITQPLVLATAARLW